MIVIFEGRVVDWDIRVLSGPITPVYFDDERFGRFFDFVAISGKSSVVKVVDFCDRSKSNEPDDNFNSIVHRAQVKNAGKLSK